MDFIYLNLIFILILHCQSPTASNSSFDARFQTIVRIAACAAPGPVNRDLIERVAFYIKATWTRLGGKSDMCKIQKNDTVEGNCVQSEVGEC